MESVARSANVREKGRDSAAIEFPGRFCTGQNVRGT